ncbi:MAG: DUF2141 domain-containing protein [Gammaproteobacteria bacterium]|nr:DUF2141 domain-containing protein [Gammaproteobacteria bacterium]
MKTFVFLLVLIAATSSLAAELTIKIKNVKHDDSTIYIAIFVNEENWPDGEPFRALSTPAEADVTTVNVEIPEGTYAVSVYQDINGNGQMDYNALRMPKEPWGVSNDAPARFGPPKWKRMKFDLGAEPFTAEFSLKH